MNFKEDLRPDFKVRISNDFKYIIFANGQENMVHERKFDADHNIKYSIQKKLVQLKSKQIICISEDTLGEGFYILGCRPYDGCIRVYHTNRKKVNLKFIKSIGPGFIKVFDFHV
jgi:hypothetical protein